MPRIAVVYDTNAYRGLSMAAFEARLKLEASHGVVGFASYAGVTELLARVRDPMQGAAAKATLRRLVVHCSETDGQTQIVRFAASLRGQVASRLFNVDVDDPSAPDSYAVLAGRVATEDDAQVELSEQLTFIEQEARRRRDTYVDELWRDVAKPVFSGATSWRELTERSELRASVLAGIKSGAGIDLLAESLVREAAAAANRVLSLDEATAMARLVVSHFRTVLEYRNLVVERVVETGADFSQRKRQNGVFDLEICGSTGAVAELRSCPVLLVSDDGDVLEAARRSDMRNRILTVGEYNQLLRRSSSDVADLAAALKEKVAV